MRGEMIILRADGEVMSTPYNRMIPLQHMQDGVGGYLEAIPYFTKYEDKDCYAFCDEEGKLKRRPLNAAATALWATQWPHRLDDCLVGDIIVITGDFKFLRSL